MGDEFIATLENGPEFEEGDRVIIMDGPFEGESGVVIGYDDHHEAYLVEFLGQCVAAFRGDLLELAPEQRIDDELPEIPDEIEIGDRVVFVRGHWVGQVGWVIQELPEHSLSFGTRVVRLVTEDQEDIYIAAVSLIRSPVQDEEDLDRVQ